MLVHWTKFVQEYFRQQLLMIGSDASNDFSEAPPPPRIQYVRIDKNYKHWYKHKYPNSPPLLDDYVLKVKRALQEGHPESPCLWATLIDKLLKNLNLLFQERSKSKHTTISTTKSRRKSTAITTKIN